MRRKIVKNKIYWMYCVLMAGTMTGCVSATVTVVNLGFTEGTIGRWLHSWGIAFPVGFVLLLVLSPVMRGVSECLGGGKG